MPYVLPQVLVFQEFEAQAAALDQPLLACVVGEQFDLHRYDVADEKADIKVATSYDPTVETAYAWPARAAGTVVDQTYSKVVMENALLKYFNDPAGDGSIIEHVAPGKNKIRAASKVWVTANGFSRSAGLLRDVKAGDVVKLLASACGSPITFFATVIGFVADQIAAIVDTAEADEDNKAATVAASASSQTAGADNFVGVTGTDHSTYNGLADGNPSETYTVEVVGGSAGGDGTTAILKVTSASGKDNQAAVTPSAFGAPTPIGTRGFKATWDNAVGSSTTPDVDGDDFIIGQKWVFTVSQTYTPATPASGGVYNGASDTNYIVEVTRGGLFADSTKPQIKVTTTTGIDLSGPHDVSTSGGAVTIGTQGVTIAFTGAGLCKGDRFVIPVTAAKPGAIRTLVLDKNLPEGLRGECTAGSSTIPAPDLDVTLYIKKTIEVPENREGFAPLKNWEQSSTELTLQAGIVAYDAEWVSGGVLQPLTVEDGTVYIQHRDRVMTNTTAVGTLSDVGEVAAALGKVHPDNPLAFGVFKALENANGEEVKYLAVKSSSPVTLEDWLFALDVLVGRDDVYSLVPLSQDKDVLDAFAAHCEAQSAPDKGRWRICWLNMKAEQVVPIYTIAEGSTADPVLATIKDDPDSAGTQYTILEAVGEKFLTAGVRAGDTIRALYSSDGFGNLTYSEYVIDEVLNEEEVRLATGPAAAVNTPSKIEVHRTLTKNEMAAEVAKNPGLFASRRAYLVWPDTVGNAGLTFPGYFLCAALAGLRGGVLPHQGLTNVEVQGFDDLSRTVDFFSATQLDTLAESGYWIVTQDPNTGVVYTRHQLSTGDQADILQKEQSITSNFDHISKNFLTRMKPFIGRGNVTPTMINILRGEIISLIEQFKNSIANDRLGPQILSAEIRELRQDPTLKDRIIARIGIELPAPFNNLELHLIAS